MPLFEVTMICKVRKSVTCECDNAEMARANPWDHAIDEMEIEQIDWQVERVRKDD